MSDYKPLGEVRSSLKIKWYRTKLEQAVLKGLTKRNNARGLFQAAGHLLIYIILGSLSFWLWMKQLWLPFIIALWFHGTVTTFFHGTATHELMHGTVFKSKKLNNFFLYIYAMLGLWNHVDYAESHKNHHFYTLYPDADRENLLPIAPMPGPFDLLQLFTINLFSPAGRTFGSGGLLYTLFFHIRVALKIRSKSKAPSMEWIEALHDDNPELIQKTAVWSRLLLLFHAAVIAGGIISGYWVLPILITAAPFIANALSYSVGVAQHSGMMTDEPDFRKLARSMKVNPITEFLYWRMNWHCEHHMYAAVPCYNLRKLSKLIKDDLPEAKSFAATWKEMLDIAKKQKEDPEYTFARPLPPTATQYE